MSKRPSPAQLSCAVIALAVLGTYLVYAQTLAEQVIHRMADDEAALTEYIKLHGVRATMQALLDESNKNDSLSCHPAAHQIGRIAYQIVGNQAFQQCDGSCHSGCYHGAMESLLHKKGTNNFIEIIEDACRTFNTNFGTHQCFHGAGHGVLAYLDYDLPAALDECRSLPSSSHQSSCMSGVFMENVVAGRGQGATSVDGDEHTTTWLSRDPHFPCNAIAQDYLTQHRCYSMQTSWMLSIFGYDLDAVIPQCLQAPNDYVATCFQGYGRDAVGRDLNNPKRILARCAKVPDRYYDNCVKGSLHVIVDFWGIDLQSQASDFCKAVDGDHQATCYQNLSARLADLSTKPRQQSPVSTSTLPTATPTISQTLTITMTDQGFVPKEITIRKGQTIAFINTGSNPHWPASNLHPTHEIYPEFDPQRRIAPGESWSFTFSRAGVWRMHDHVYANFSGAITVTE